MKPTLFKGANGTLSGGPASHYGTDDDVIDLPVYRGQGSVLSCWQLSWLERFRVLWSGRVWLWVLGRTHAPVSMQAENPFPKEPSK